MIEKDPRPFELNISSIDPTEEPLRLSENLEMKSRLLDQICEKEVNYEEYRKKVEAVHLRRSQPKLEAFCLTDFSIDRCMVCRRFFQAGVGEETLGLCIPHRSQP